MLLMVNKENISDEIFPVFSVLVEGDCQVGVQHLSPRSNHPSLLEVGLREGMLVVLEIMHLFLKYKACVTYLGHLRDY